MPSSDWDYSPKDATRLAAIRWFANSIENLSIVLYATSPDTFANTERILKQCLNELLVQRQQFGNGDIDCPDGYVPCRGLCMPSCDTDAFASAERASKK